MWYVMENKSKYIILLLFIHLIIGHKCMYAQESHIYRGIVLSSDTTLLLKGIHVLNLNSKRHTTSDANGNFELYYRLNDTIEFRHDNWVTTKVYGERLKDSVFLEKKNIVLDEILITRNSSNQRISELKTIQKEKNMKGGIHYGGRPPIALLSPFGGKPITFFYELLSKEGRRARKMERNIKNQIDEDEIDKTFNAHAIMVIIPIKDGEIFEFMETYRPTLEQVRSWNTYDFHLYLKNSYDAFTETGLPKASSDSTRTY